ncbi:uncharacterized protein BDCG_17858 [Blastomyces dermatitidis ER-3]|uniref:Uncharacterized protein n=1 Tax=Ajellomyces dermatitidis (strain ER-3 / ATCC MYA-2586) TaxID=559297 RepID=A0ABX2W0Q1_AJEDR|nr:uncharacterized protein BDCG_17858 [Blastomyces dermatitidis ER-3]OAT02960.1 hypothetical protein BDCG_17858 [Blastomyces dermatitidis ER-3]
MKSLLRGATCDEWRFLFPFLTQVFQRIYQSPLPTIIILMRLVYKQQTAGKQLSHPSSTLCPFFCYFFQSC